MASAFNFRTLHSLKLRFCTMWGEFLRHAGSSQRPIRLKTLEIQDIDAWIDEASDISAFLEVIEDLE